MIFPDLRKRINAKIGLLAKIIPAEIIHTKVYPFQDISFLDLCIVDQYLLFIV